MLLYVFGLVVGRHPSNAPFKHHYEFYEKTPEDEPLNRNYRWEKTNAN